MKLDFATDAGIGTRAALGVIVLETDETLEHEFARLLGGEGIALHVSRIAMVPQVRPDTLARMEADLPASARLLPGRPFDAVGFGCTSAATVIGPDRVAEAVRRGCPGAAVTDPLSALIAAGRALGLRRLGFVTPYVPEVSARMRDRLEAAGFAIAGFGSFGEGDDRIVARIAPASILAAIEQVAAQAPCDGVVVACTNLRCLGIIPEAEARTGLPVLSSNQAMAWHMLRLAGLDDGAPGGGQLFGAGLAPDTGI